MSSGCYWSERWQEVGEEGGDSVRGVRGEGMREGGRGVPMRKRGHEMTEGIRERLSEVVIVHSCEVTPRWIATSILACATAQHDPKNKRRKQV